MESPKLGPRVKVFKEENDSHNLTLGPSLSDSLTEVWPEIERISHIFFAVTAFKGSKAVWSASCIGKLSPLSLPCV